MGVSVFLQTAGEIRLIGPRPHETRPGGDEGVRSVPIEAFIEVSVDIEYGPHACVTQPGCDHWVVHPCSIRRATWLWRRSWNRMGSPTDSSTAGFPDTASEAGGPPVPTLGEVKTCRF